MTAPEPGAGRGRLAQWWAPLGAAGVYLAVLALQLRPILDQVNWDADADSPMVLAEGLRRGLGGGTLRVGHVGYYPMLAFDLLTGGLPAHRQAWVAFPLLLGLSGLGILVLVAWRLAGAWAGALTGALGVAAGPAVLLNLAGQGYRAATFFSAALLAGLLVYLARPGRRPAVAWAAALAVALVTGFTLASDAFLALWGLAPFVLAPALLALAWRRPEDLSLAGRATVVAGVAVLVAVVTTIAAERAGFRAVPVDTRLATAVEAAGNLRLLATDVLIIFAGAAGSHNLLLRVVSLGAGVVGCVGLAGVLALAPWGLSRGPAAAPPLFALTTIFWATSVALVGLAFVLSNFAVDTGSTRYLLMYFYAVAAVVPLWASRRRLPRQVAGLLVASFCLAGAGTLQWSVKNRIYQPRHTLALPAVVAFLDAHGLSRGYSSYWDANSISWKTGGRIMITPMVENSTGDRQFVSNVLTAGYGPVPSGRTFVLVDPQVVFVQVPPTPALGMPLETHHFDRFTVLVYASGIGDKLLPP